MTQQAENTRALQTCEQLMLRFNFFNKQPKTVHITAVALAIAGLIADRIRPLPLETSSAEQLRPDGGRFEQQNER